MMRVEPDQASFNRVSRALDAEADGVQLRRDLVTELRQAVEPAIGEVRGRLMASGSGGLPHDGEPLRSTIAAGVKPKIRTKGRSAGVSIVAHKRGMPRGFVNAPKRFNQRHFRHRIFGKNVWVLQVGAPEWFDGPLRGHQDRYRQRVEAAMEHMVKRIVTRRV